MKIHGYLLYGVLKGAFWFQGFYEGAKAPLILQKAYRQVRDARLTVKMAKRRQAPSQTQNTRFKSWKSCENRWILEISSFFMYPWRLFDLWVKWTRKDLFYNPNKHEKLTETQNKFSKCVNSIWRLWKSENSEFLIFDQYFSLLTHFELCISCQHTFQRRQMLFTHFESLFCVSDSFQCLFGL